MNRAVEMELENLSPETLDAVEISGRNHADRPWKSYVTYDFPEFDLCNPPPQLPRFDVVLCEQVLEHVVDPWRAIRTLHDLARAGGHVVITTPFLFRLHNDPEDFWRFTPDGMKVLVRSAGLEVLKVDTWGNRAAVRGLLGRDLPYRFWRSLKNDPPLPVVVWAFARRPLEADGPENDARPG
jgi:SAM-dependent methyltransferase